MCGCCEFFGGAGGIWNVNAKVVANVAAVALVRAAAPGLACHNFSSRSVGRGSDLRNHGVSTAVGARRSGDVIFLCMYARRDSFT